MIELRSFIAFVLIIKANAEISDKQTPQIIQNNYVNCTCIDYKDCFQRTLDAGGKASDVRISATPCRNNLEVCCDESNPTEQKSKGCGFRNPNGLGFQRIGGAIINEAFLGEFPWMVAVLEEVAVEWDSRKKNKFLCGGSLIHPRVVLTAAHCAIKTNHTLKVRAGEWDTQVSNDYFKHQDGNVSSVVVHPLYHPKTYENDVALLILSETFRLGEHIDLICLNQEDVVFDDRNCLSSGWGKDAFGNVGKYQAILKRIDLRMVPRDLCQKQLRSTRLGKNFDLHRSFLCAIGEGGKDMCTGDGGSPLVCPIVGETNRYVQVGIVAWGIGCGNDQIPGVYVNVSMFQNWIRKQMTLNNLDYTSHQYYNFSSIFY